MMDENEGRVLDIIADLKSQAAAPTDELSVGGLPVSPSPPLGLVADSVSGRMDNLEISIMESSQVLCRLDELCEDLIHKMEQTVATCRVDTRDSKGDDEKLNELDRVPRDQCG